MLECKECLMPARNHLSGDRCEACVKRGPGFYQEQVRMLRSIILEMRPHMTQAGIDRLLHARGYVHNDRE